jgi:hypothetical protein
MHFLDLYWHPPDETIPAESQIRCARKHLTTYEYPIGYIPVGVGAGRNSSAVTAAATLAADLDDDHRRDRSVRLIPD